MRLALLLAVLANLARPLPTGAEITISTKPYPNQADNPVSAEAKELVTKAIYRLVDDPKLANHPIRRYLNDPSVLAPIIFDNPYVHRNQARTTNNEIHLNSGDNFVDHLTSLIHEFIHIDLSEKYLVNLNYSFLKPEDYAFQNLMEEAFGNTIEMWARLVYSEIPTDKQVRNWRSQTNLEKIADAMKNDLQVEHPNYSEEQINAMIPGELFNMFMTRSHTYSSQTIPNNMRKDYGNKNTVLISEYAAYRERGDALLRHQWNYLASLMPFKLPANMTYDYYRSRFMQDVRIWAQYANNPEESILYWINYDAVGNARAKLAGKKDLEISYDYLPQEDEQRLNRVFKEIDPYFTPVDTTLTLERMWQELSQNKR